MKMQGMINSNKMAYPINQNPIEFVFFFGVNHMRRFFKPNKLLRWSFYEIKVSFRNLRWHSEV